MSPAASRSDSDRSGTRVSRTPAGSESSTFSRRPGALAPAWTHSTSVSGTPASSASQPRIQTAAECAHSGEPTRLPRRSAAVSMPLRRLT
jgi:hypothetical protein